MSYRIPRTRIIKHEKPGENTYYTCERQFWFGLWCRINEVEYNPLFGGVWRQSTKYYDIAQKAIKSFLEEHSSSYQEEKKTVVQEGGESNVIIFTKQRV
jgi:hypothetical protein